MGQLAQSVREHPLKSFPNDTETNPKQCMVVTLRSGKELEELKKNSNEEEQSENRKEEAEIEENMEAKTKEKEARVNNRGEKQKSNRIVPRRTTFLYSPPMHTPPLPFPHKFRKTKLDA